MPNHIDPEVDLAIVGGGVIGLAVAWRAREKGLSVTLLERGELGRGTSYVAAGMLAPVAEVEFGEAGRAALELGLRSAELWPEFAAELERAGGGTWGCGGRARSWWPATRTRRASCERQIAFREIARAAHEPPARERGACARAGARADGAPGAGGPG